MEDYVKCNKCDESQHEGNFCRCEDRNIRIAKEKRLRNDTWFTKQPERLSEKTPKGEAIV